VLAYGTGELGVQHIIVMGHYGCGGVEAAILSKPTSQDAGSGAVQQWIQSIREILSSSPRAELVDLRARISAKPIEELEIQDRKSLHLAFAVHLLMLDLSFESRFPCPC